MRRRGVRSPRHFTMPRPFESLRDCEQQLTQITGEAIRLQITGFGDTVDPRAPKR